MSGARSTKGCHTCRVRKKKCDEQHPVCQSCISRSITCYGYGPKPAWMDGGEKEEEMIKDIRKVAERNYRERRKPWNKVKAGAALNHGLTDRGVKFGKGEEGVGGVEMLPWHAVDFGYGKGVVSSLPGGNLPVLPGIYSPGRTRFQPTSNDPEESLPTLPGIYSPGGRTFQSAYSNGLLPPKTPSQTLPMHRLFWESGLSTASPGSPPRSSHELSLLMHYLDVVFPLQFGFYRRTFSAPDHGRGWLLQLALRSQSFYHTSLSISICHQEQLKSGTTLIQTTQDLAKNHAKSLKGLKETIDDMHRRELTGAALWDVAWEVLACMNNMTSVEVFRGLSGNWLIHLTAARTLLTMLAAKLNATVPGLTHQDLYTHILDTSPSPHASFFLTSFLWVDIIAQATGLQDPTPSYLNYPFLMSPPPTNPLGPPLLDLQSLMGCENWAMKTLLDIATLAAWKRANPSTSPSDPSAIELNKRAAVIRKRLNGGLGALLARRQFVLRGQDGSAEHDSSIVTELFALSALVYLSVAVHGARPQVREIRGDVSATLRVLARLPRRLLLRVSWPICVTGCMAVGEGERDVVREVVGLRARSGDSGVGGVVKTQEGTVGVVKMKGGWEGNSGTVWKGMRVVEECWRVHDLDGDREYGWLDGMDTLGLKILLV